MFGARAEGRESCKVIRTGTVWNDSPYGARVTAQRGVMRCAVMVSKECLADGMRLLRRFLEKGSRSHRHRHACWLVKN